jgi:nitroimidazol reductase NimA-like FMN-containing flavoprotein (pyridoxamine 5'-phosphate oxidase superfamily)
MARTCRAGWLAATCPRLPRSVLAGAVLTRDTLGGALARTASISLCAPRRGLLPGVHESHAEVAALQELIDRSYASAGAHLLSIHTRQRRMSAEELVERLTGACLLALATVTADGHPLVGPVDGVFYRGAFHFGSAPNSVRLRHLRARPHVSATHLPGEELAVTVHGRANPIDVRGAEAAGFRQMLLAVYGPRYGEDARERFLVESGALYARIEPDRMFALRVL